jgi:hypothetical protein
MNNEPYAVILVPSTSYALKAERALEQAGIACKLIPVPRQLSSDCGSCVRVFKVEKEQARQTLITAKIEIEAVHDL